MEKENLQTVRMVSDSEWNEMQASLKRIEETVTTRFDEKRNELITPKEFCETFKIGRNTYERWWRKGIVKTCQVGKRKYIERSEVQRLLERGRN
jgi:hypothetical protein